MRLSIDKRDPGFQWDKVGLKCRIYLNGEEVTHAVTADEEQGFIVQYKLKEDGTPCINYAASSFMTERVDGHVRIVMLGEDGRPLNQPKVTAEWVEGQGIAIYVYSRMKPKAIRRVKVPVDLMKTTNHKLVSVLVQGAALEAAEYLHKSYGDTFEPKEISLMANEEVARIMKDLGIS